MLSKTKEKKNYLHIYINIYKRPIAILLFSKMLQLEIYMQIFFSSYLL